MTDHKATKRALAEMASRLVDEGEAPDAVIEGLLKGAAVVLLRTGRTMAESADVIDAFAAEMRLEEPGAHVRPTVQ